MPPKSAFRTTGSSKPKPVVKAKVTPADRARLEWAAFDSWLSIQRKEAEAGKTAKLQELRLELESAKKTVPKGFHSTLMKGYEEKKKEIAKGVQFELVLRSRDEWDDRLEKAGLKAEDWDPMTYAEQEAVKAALAGDSDDEDYAPHEIPETVDSSALHRNQAINVQQTNAYLDVPSLAAKRRVQDADRTKSLSPLPDLPDGFRSQTPNRIPPSPSYTPGYTALFSEAKPLGTRYTGPVLVEENKIESPEDADFAKFKMSIREQMIREFHDEAATQEIILVRKEHEAKLEADAIKALVSGHELNMEELRRRKEEKRKAIVDVERTKRKTEMRMRNSTPKGTTSTQPDLAAQMENFRKEQRRASAQAQRPPTTNETYPVPDEPIEEPPADVPTSSNQPTTGKTETKKQKKGGKASKKAAASRVQLPNSKADAAPEQQSGEPAEVARPPELKTQAKPRGILKDPSTRFDRKPTVEEVSDEEGDSVAISKKASPKQQGNVPTKIFTEPNRAPSTNPFGPDSDDEIVTRFARVYEPKMKKPAKSSPPKQQFETPMFSNDDENQSYWDILNGGMGMEQQRGDVSESTQSSSGGTQSSGGGKHAVWAPPSFHDDSADEDEDEDSSDLFQSLAFGAIPVDPLPSAPWAGGGLYGQFSAPNPKTNNVAAKPDPRNKHVSKSRASMGTSQGVSSPNGAGEPALDGPNWEAAMMGRFFGPTHSSASYAKRPGAQYL